ncbi:META and DUF4377 domain-containing protein [Gulbenkiania mobilis]|uniref:Heat shock protein HslJ n=1 Tax=Gulbenkiania mobilis TaxID=397457 RepID=A0ABY2CZS9_GULMO|nr:heat shock protein HslJ [Gulbenkiania mobilis]
MKPWKLVFPACLIALPVLAAPAASQWELVSPKVSGRVPTLTIEGGRISGFAGCNRYFGSVGPNGPHPIGSTRMMCPPDRMQIEKDFLTVLSGARFEPDPATEELVLEAEGKRYVFRRTAAPSAKPPASANLVGAGYLYVSEHPGKCDDGTRCLRVRTAPGQPWQVLPGGIQGFTPEAGVRYYLKLKPAMPGQGPVLERVVMTEKAERTVTPVPSP